MDLVVKYLLVLVVVLTDNLVLYNSQPYIASKEIVVFKLECNAIWHWNP